MGKKAVQFGAGNIGRGFMGQLYYETGYHVTFVDVAENLVEGLATRHSYPIRIVGEGARTIPVDNVTAIHASDTEAVARALAEADMASTAVGGPILPKIAPNIAAGITKRFENTSAPPLDIIVCENLIGAGRILRHEVRKCLPESWHNVLDEKVGFVEASIGRMVPIMTEELKAEDPLLVCVEAFCELPVDANGFKGAIPELRHMQPHPNFDAYVERKLYVHNLAHAVTSYLGYLKGHEFIWQAVTDSAIRKETEGATGETSRALAAKHGLPLEDFQAHVADLLRRFQNKDLNDQVERVAKDPIRKLGPEDRLIGAAILCETEGVPPVHVCFAAAAAMFFDHSNDEAAARLQDIRREQGPEGVLREVCKLDLESSLAKLIINGTERLKREGWI